MTPQYTKYAKLQHYEGWWGGWFHDKNHNLNFF